MSSPLPLDGDDQEQGEERAHVAEEARETEETVFVAQETGCFLRIVPVRIVNVKNGKRMDINVLQDDGSTSNLLDSEVAEVLGLTGTLVRSTITGLGVVKNTADKILSNVQIQSMHRKFQQNIPV